MWTSIKRYHIFYQRRGFYKFLSKVSVQFLAVMAPILLALALFEQFTPGTDYYFGQITPLIRQELILGIFFVNEAILGLIPPDLFIIWAKQFASPYAMVALLSVLSYGGGLVAYYLGGKLVNVNRLGHYVNVKFAKQFAMLKSWGGFIIIVAALLPLPYSTMCLGAGMLKYSFKSLLLLGMFRIVRFFAYAAVLYQVV
jgi:membrane protein YqaA with SNARE-associated domain